MGQYISPPMIIHRKSLNSPLTPLGFLLKSCTILGTNLSDRYGKTMYRLTTISKEDQ